MKMINLRSVLFATVLVAGVAGCSRQSCPEIENPLHKEGAVSFRTNIVMRQTRVTGTKWDLSDAIGVYAVEAGKNLPQGVYNSFANVKYTTPGTGVFSAAATSITFPKEGALDFVAYYPYAETLAQQGQLPLDVKDQSNLSAIDVLYSNDAKSKTQDVAEVPLTFHHVLSLIELTVTTEKPISNITAKLSGLKTNGTLQLADGVVTVGTESAEVALQSAVNEKTATLKGILIPSQDLKDAKVVITVDSQTYEWTPKAQGMESRKKYVYSLELKSDGKIKDLSLSGATIVDWESGNTPGAPVVLEPVTPEAPKPTDPATPTGEEFFAGSKFEDWAAFEASMNKYGLKHGTRAEGKGHTGDALHINGSPARNDYLFTVNAAGTSFAGKTKIVFYVKGTSSKSLSFNIYNNENLMLGYNLGDLATETKTLTAASEEFATGIAVGNSYAGTIDTQGQWVRVEMDIAKFADQIATVAGKNLFAVKIGKLSSPDLYIDDITVE